MFESPADLAALIPETITEPFTMADLASDLSIPRWLAQKMAFCMRSVDAIAIIGKKGNAIQYGKT